MKKTNAARILDRMKIKYGILTYDVDESDLSAMHVAESTGISIDRIFKTLVLKGDKSGIFVACIPGAAELDLKALSIHSGNKKCAMVPLKEVNGLTGYLRGGCSPIGMKKNYPLYIDESVNNFQKICVSAGLRGMQFEIAPADLINATSAKCGKII